MDRTRSLVLTLFFLLASPLAAEDAWAPVGPPGGLAQSVAVHPRNPNVLWAGTSNAGLFKSLDGGASWSPVNQGVPLFVSISALAVAPGDPAVVYAVANNLGGTLQAILRSSDGGRSWSAVLSCSPSPASGIACARLLQTHEIDVDPRNPQVVYASTGRGVFKSVDGGARWVPTGRLGFDRLTYTLAIDPRNPRVLYAGGNDGVARSRDGGTTWKPWNEGIGAVWIREIAIDPRDPRRMWAAGNVRRGVFRSTDGGAHWQQARRSLTATAVDTLALSPRAGRLPVVWAGTSRGLFRSLDGGITWAESPELRDLLVSELAAHPGRPGAVWAAIPVSFRGDRVPGIYRTRDGEAWSLSTRGLGLPVWSLAFDPAASGVLWAASPAAGAFRSTDGGSTWVQRNGNLQSFGVTQVYTVEVDPGDPQTVWAGTSLGIYVTRDGGATWEPRHGDLVPAGSHSFPIYLLRISAADPSVAYAASRQDLYRTTDGGESWTRMNVPVTLPPLLWIFGDVLIDARDPDVVFVAAQELWITRDGGATWQRSQGDPIFFVQMLGADPQDSDVLYASGVGFYRSLDGGRLWQSVNAPLPEEPTDLAVGPTGEVWIGGYETMIRSTDQGSHWTRAPDLPRLFPREIEIDPHDADAVFAATDAGIFRLVEVE